MIEFWEVQRPRGKVLYGIRQKAKKAKYWDPGFNKWWPSMVSSDSVREIGLQVTPPQNVIDAFPR